MQLAGCNNLKILKDCGLSLLSGLKIDEFAR